MSYSGLCVPSPPASHLAAVPQLSPNSEPFLRALAGHVSQEWLPVVRPRPNPKASYTPSHLQFPGSRPSETGAHGPGARSSRQPLLTKWPFPWATWTLPSAHVTLSLTPRLPGADMTPYITEREPGALECGRSGQRPPGWGDQTWSLAPDLTPELLSPPPFCLLQSLPASWVLPVYPVMTSVSPWAPLSRLCWRNPGSREGRRRLEGSRHGAGLATSPPLSTGANTLTRKKVQGPTAPRTPPGGLAPGGTCISLESHDQEEQRQ